MQQKGIWPPAYTTMYFLALAFLVSSLPLSKFTMSFFQFGTLLFWLWHGVRTEFLQAYTLRKLLNPSVLTRFLGEVIKEVFAALIRKFLEFFRNKPAMAIASVMVLHVIGLLYTTDFNYAIRDLRIKLPIIILPLFIATGPRITTKTFYWILACFVAAVLGGSIYRLILYLNLPVADKRAISAHTSHIRYSLNAVYAIFIIFFFVQSKRLMDWRFKTIILLIAFWLIGFMVFMNYSTGILLLTSISLLLLLFLVFKIKHVFLKVSLIAIAVLMISLPLFYVFSVGNNYLNTPAIEFDALEKYTPRGNSYYHDTVNFRSKSGTWTGLYICDKELRQAWAERSNTSLDSLDKKKQLRRFALISFLASKNLRKDADGVKQLTDTEIRMIEGGVNDADYQKLPGLQSQLEDFIAGYQRYVNLHDPNSGSMVQRFEYWRTSLIIIKQHPVFGVGTGDLRKAFTEQYIKMNSGLSEQNRLRSHNQYLAITIAFGLFGLVWYLFVMFYPGIHTRNFNNYFYIIFWIIFMLSMITEDTIETQEGATFYALFTAIMLLGREKTEKSESLFN